MDFWPDFQWTYTNGKTGEKFHISNKEYYDKIRAVSDRLCRKYGLSIVMEEAETSKASSYGQWLRLSKREPTFWSMLEADIRETIEEATSLGDFFMVMEHKGYEIRHGNRLSYRMRGQERFMCPERKNPLFTEDGIIAAINGNLDAIEAGLRPVVVRRPVFVPYQKHPKYTGFMALYVHYLYILGKIEKRQYPPRMTPQMRKDLTRFEQMREQFQFLRDNDISTAGDMAAYKAKAEEKLAGLTKQRTILNVRKRRHRKLYAALADAEALAETRKLYAEGVPGLETEVASYYGAVAVLEKSGIDRNALKQEKAGLYDQLAEVNRETRDVRKKLKMCAEIKERVPKIQRDIQKQKTVRQMKRQKQIR